MALTTTIGGANSDSYATLAEYEAHITAQGLQPLQGSNASHEAELRRAALWIDESYSFVGFKQYETQSRAWPRLTSKLVDGWPIKPDVIPQAVKSAQIEMAYVIHRGTDPFANYEGAVKRTLAEVGPIVEEIEYAGAKARPQFTAVDRLLRPYIIGGLNQARLVRS